VYQNSLPTRGQALTAVYAVLLQMREELGDFMPAALGVTGSGRKMVSELVGADLSVNEITAHATGGIRFYPEVDSIFDIGGQDSKFISVRNGTVDGFEMNKVCSAGTGSFIEEVSELLGLDIVNEFAQEAMQSLNPLDFGERCTVFMSSELLRRQQQGHNREDLAAGLCYSIAQNYLARVVGRHAIGVRILLQGGVANNRAVVAAMEQVTGKSISVHEYNDVAGAIGAALIAADESNGASDFRGFDNLDVSNLTCRCLECEECANRCTIHLTADEGGRRFFSGGLCERYEGQAIDGEAGQDRDIPDLFAEREGALQLNLPANPVVDETTIGIPRALLGYDLLPFWSRFFASLGIDHTFSEATTIGTIERGTTLCHPNTCLPLATLYGHCFDLIDRGVRRIFLPSVPNLSFLTGEERLNHLCPAVQASPFMARTLFPAGISFLTPTVRFSIPSHFRSDIDYLGRLLDRNRRETGRALQEALEAQDTFYEAMLGRGREILGNRDPELIQAVILSRSYTVCDPRIQLRLNRILRDLGIVAIPMDMIPVEPGSSRDLNGMYWYFGKRVLQVARELKRSGDLPVISLSNYGCGPDSFIKHMLRHELQNVPLLELDIDAHSDLTGIQTRLEAFRYSLEAWSPAGEPDPLPDRVLDRASLREHQLLIPQMSDHAFAFSAAFQSCQVNAKVMPLPDEDSIAIGKKSVGGDECLPCSFVIGDMLHHMNNRQDEDLDPAFFMISGDGPCRLGQYPWLQRRILDEAGFSQVPIFNASQDPAFYEQLGVVSSAFHRRVWRGSVAIDLLHRKWRSLRAYVPDRKELDAVYSEEISHLQQCIRDQGSLTGQLRAGFSRLESLKPDHSGKKPVIVLLGENYVRCNPIANSRIADMLEDLGAEVWFPALYEWIYYTNWTARLHCRYEGQFLRRLKLYAIDAVQHIDAFRLARAVRGRLKYPANHSIRRILRKSSRYVPSTFEGETALGIGWTIDYHERGVDGVIHVAPFGCMSGTIIDVFSERLSEDLGGFPVMSLQFDGQQSELQRNRLSGFMVRIDAWRKRGAEGLEPSATMSGSRSEVPDEE
ncbi:acyl-CoA dehydratase activase-related protein, partial [Gemmatimonadota bacterium]